MFKNELKRIFNNKDIKEELLKNKINPYNLFNKKTLLKEEINDLKSDKRFNIRVMAHTTNNDNMIIIYHERKYYNYYNYKTNKFIIENY